MCMCVQWRRKRESDIEDIFTLPSAKQTSFEYVCVHCRVCVCVCVCVCALQSVCVCVCIKSFSRLLRRGSTQKLWLIPSCPGASPQDCGKSSLWARRGEGDLGQQQDDTPSGCWTDSQLQSHSVLPKTAEYLKYRIYGSAFSSSLSFSPFEELSEFSLFIFLSLSMSPHIRLSSELMLNIRKALNFCWPLLLWTALKAHPFLHMYVEASRHCKDLWCALH